MLGRCGEGGILCCFFGDCSLDFDGVAGGVVKHTWSLFLAGDLRLDLGGELVAVLACSRGLVAAVSYNLSIADGSESKSSPSTKLAATRGSFLPQGPEHVLARLAAPATVVVRSTDVDLAVATPEPVSRPLCRLLGERVGCEWALPTTSLLVHGDSVSLRRLCEGPRGSIFRLRPWCPPSTNSLALLSDIRLADTNCPPVEAESANACAPSDAPVHRASNTELTGATFRGRCRRIRCFSSLLGIFTIVSCVESMGRLVEGFLRLDLGPCTRFRAGVTVFLVEDPRESTFV